VLKAEYPSLSLNSSEKKHVPYIFLLLWALDEWRLQKSTALGINDGRSVSEAESRVPVTFDEKNEFRALLKTLILEKWSLGATTGGDPASDGSSEADGTFSSPAGMNGEEAMREAHRVFSDKTLTPEIVDYTNILNSKDDLSDEKNRPLKIQFYRRLLRTLSTFMQQEGFRLPLPGAVPDLTATSTRYLQLQHIYHEQSNRDCEVFVRLLRAREVEEQVPPECVVPHDEAVSFCKSVLVTSLLSTTQVSHEENGELFPNFGEHLMNDVFDEDPLQTPLAWALAIRACDVFFMQQGRYPGDDLLQAQKAENESWKSEDAEKVWAILKDLAGKCNASIANEDETQAKMDEGEGEDSYKPPATIAKSTAIEITRYGAAELHPISALVGGVAAQEAVKLITGQYVPLDGLFVYNGISSIGGTYSLKG